jgi:hypothetical protein
LGARHRPYCLKGAGYAFGSLFFVLAQRTGKNAVEQDASTNALEAF